MSDQLEGKGRSPPQSEPGRGRVPRCREVTTDLAKRSRAPARMGRASADRHASPQSKTAAADVHADRDVPLMPGHGISPREIASIFEQRRGLIRRWLTKGGVSAADVSDLGQEVFLGMLKPRSPFRGESSMLTWIHGICRNLASHYRRRATRDEPSPVPPAPALSSPEVLYEDKELEAVVRRQLAGLSARHRLVLQLLDVNGDRSEDVALVFGLTAQGLRTLHHRARKELKAALMRADPTAFRSPSKTR